MQQTLEKLNKEFTRELKSMEAIQQRERRIAEKNAIMLKTEISRLQKANAEEVKRLSRQLAADREAMQKKLALQEKILKNKSEAERKLLLAKMERDAAAAQARLVWLKNELASANKSLRELNKKFDENTVQAVAAPVAEADAVTRATPTVAGDKQ